MQVGRVSIRELKSDARNRDAVGDHSSLAALDSANSGSAC
jgi:hypothetical protein